MCTHSDGQGLMQPSINKSYREQHILIRYCSDLRIAASQQNLSSSETIDYLAAETWNGDQVGLLNSELLL